MNFVDFNEDSDTPDVLLQNKFKTKMPRLHRIFKPTGRKIPVLGVLEDKYKKISRPTIRLTELFEVMSSRCRKVLTRKHVNLGKEIHTLVETGRL